MSASVSNYPETDLTWLQRQKSNMQKIPKETHDWLELEEVWMKSELQFNFSILINKKTKKQWLTLSIIDLVLEKKKKKDC